MALTKDKKSQIVAETSELLNSSKLTVFAKYPGTSVKSMQKLRKDSRESGTQIRVIKNRLFKKAAENSGVFKDTDLGRVEGQLLYAFNAADEVAPAQDLAKFGKTETQLEFVGALTRDGQFLGPIEVKELASLPSKDQLRAQLIGTLSAPISGFATVLSANLRGLINVLSARADSQT